MLRPTIVRKVYSKNSLISIAKAGAFGAGLYFSSPSGRLFSIRLMTAGLVTERLSGNGAFVPPAEVQSHRIDIGGRIRSETGFLLENQSRA